MEEIQRNCTNCGTELKFLKRDHLQLGKTSWVFGDWPNLLAGALDTEIWCCPACGKLEFYFAQGEAELEEEGEIAKITCPHCGCEHDLDDPKCPRCREKNTSLY